MANRKQYLAAIAAHVINGLPAPLNVDLCYGGDPDHLGITLDTIAEAREWLALDPKAFAYDYRYDPKEGHPNGFRIVGGNVMLLGAKVHIKACEDLPGPVGTDAETVLAFAAADVAPPAGDAVAADMAVKAVTAPDFKLGPVDEAAYLNDVSVAVTGAEDVAASAYWCAAEGRLCDPETLGRSCHLCPTAAEPIPAPDPDGDLIAPDGEV